jgi:hypothetical protein
MRSSQPSISTVAFQAKFSRRTMFLRNCRWIFLGCFLLVVLSSAMPVQAGIINGGFETIPWEEIRMHGIENTVIDGWLMDFSHRRDRYSIFEIDSGDASEGNSYIFMQVIAIDGSSTLSLSTDSSFSAPSGSIISFDYRCNVYMQYNGDIIYSRDDREDAKVIIATSQGNVTQSLPNHQGWTRFSYAVPSNTEATNLKFVGSTWGYPGSRNNYTGWVLLSIDNVQVVPEPAALTILAMGIGGMPLLLWQRRRNKKKAKG